jgi:predicted RNase H-like HicB family nuclease
MDLKLIIERHPDGFVAYPLGLKGVVVGQGDTYEDAVTDVKSAIAFHIQTFGNDVFEADDRVLEVFVAETRLAA